MISFIPCSVKGWERGLRRLERIGGFLIRGLSFLPFTSSTALCFTSASLASIPKPSPSQDYGNKRFGMSTDYRFWWIKIKALARNKDWEGLEAFAKSKKSPIGYEPFVVSWSSYRLSGAG
jgi:hypothetical protein